MSDGLYARPSKNYPDLQDKENKPNMKRIQFLPAAGQNKPHWKRGAAKTLSSLGLLALAAAANAQTISVDFVGGTGTNQPGNMAPSEVAGVVPVPNWNNATSANGGPLALVDSTGAATPATVTWAAAATYASGIPNTPGDYHMMKGFLDQSGNNPGPFSATTVTVAGLNAANTYGVYVYAVGDNPGRAGKYTIGSQTFYQTNNVNFNGVYTRVTSTNASAPGAGNYMFFTVIGQTTFTMNAVPTNFRSPVNGIQIVNLSVAPAAPTNLAAVATNNLVSLSFAGSAGAISYNVYRGTTAGGESATPLATGITGTTYNDTTAVNGVTYYYIVKAVNNTGTSGPSNEVSATPAAALVGTGTGIAGVYFHGAATDFSAQNGTPYLSDILPVINFNFGNTTGYNATAFPSDIIAGNGANTNFTAVWTALVQAPYTGPYQFQTITDDGARLTVNGVVQFDDETGHGPLANTGATMNLIAGQKYTLKFEYFQGVGGATAQLLYNPAGLGFQIIPQSQLYPTFPAVPAAITNLTALGGTNSVTLSFTAPLYGITYSIYRGTTAGGESATPIATGVTGTTYTDNNLTNGVTYFYYVVASNNVGVGPASNEASAAPTTPIIGNGDGLYGTYYGGAYLDYSAETGTPIGFGVVPNINFSNDAAVGNSPGPFPSNLPAQNYTAVWTGQFLAPYTATYTFEINSDDGSRLSIGTDSTPGTLALAVDDTAFQGPTAKTTAAYNLVAGQKYSIEMEYFQGGGNETAQLLYSIAGGPFTIIPQTQLFSAITNPPAQVIDLTAVAYSNAVHLYWTNTAYAVTYNVYRGVTAGGESATPIATGLTAAPYIDNTAVNGVTYYYVVKGVNATGTGLASNEVSATPLNVISTIAFWRFEEGVAGAQVVPGVQLPDSSNHNNTLQTPDTDHAPTYSSSVPSGPTNPLLSNALSMDFSANPGGTAAARELNTGGATGDINTHQFPQMTLEASFNPSAIGGYQTIVGREGMSYPGDTITGDADLYLQLIPVNGLNFLSIRGHQTSNGQFIICNGVTSILAGQWYNAAAVADGHTLSLYLQTTPNGAYNLENSVPFLGAVGNQNTNWSVGRGFYGGAATDRYFGAADEIRISDNALSPSQFLFAPIAGATVTGRVSLEGVPDLSAVSPSAPLGTFTVTFRTAGTATVVKTATVTLAVTAGSANGTFSVSGVPAGTYDVIIKGRKNLAVLSAGVVVGATTGTVPLVSLPAGDSNNDNFVDSSDFGTLIGAFNTDGSIAGSGYDPTVDFNFDGLVDSSDFGLLIGEFNNAGAM